ncbi:TPA: amidase, partial [Candidatus Poribacteria bacterium]|nr:amidase [Candidatus Poribacteria bacterium]
MKYFFSIGLASILLPVVLWSKLRKPQEDKKLTIGTLKEATKISGLEFTETELEMMLEGLNQQLKNYQKLRSVPLANDVPSSLGFDPIMPGMTFPETQHPLK